MTPLVNHARDTFCACSVFDFTHTKPYGKQSAIAAGHTAFINSNKRIIHHLARTQTGARHVWKRDFCVCIKLEQHQVFLHARYRGGVHSNLWYIFGQLRAQVGRDIWFAVIIISCFVSKPKRDFISSPYKFLESDLKLCILIFQISSSVLMEIIKSCTMLLFLCLAPSSRETEEFGVWCFGYKSLPQLHSYLVCVWKWFSVYVHLTVVSLWAPAINSSRPNLLFSIYQWTH